MTKIFPLESLKNDRLIINNKIYDIHLKNICKSKKRIVNNI